MNYIKRLEQENAKKDAIIAAAQEEITEILSYLQSPKFNGTDLDGSSKDWVSAREMVNRLRGLQQTIADAEFKFHGDCTGSRTRGFELSV